MSIQQKSTERVHILFEDLAINTDYKILEWGKDDDEIKEIAIKRGLVIPSKDLAIFKGRYALVDTENKNKCTLPAKEVKKALKTLIGKAIDKDHFRRATIGYWLDAELEDEEIISYGAFWKSNFPEEYQIIKDKMTSGKMKLSFEAWGDRVYKEDGSYDLTNIEFAGGALLFDTEPAFPNAEVMEFSNRVLEFAKIISKQGDNLMENLDKYIEELASKSEISEEELGKLPKEVTDCVKNKTKEGIKPVDAVKQCWLEYKKLQKSNVEEAKLDFNYDYNTIARMIYQAKCKVCDSIGWNEVLSIDFENSKLRYKCNNCQTVYESDLTPQTIIKKKGKKIDKQSELQKSQRDNKTEKMTLDDIKKLIEEANEDSVILDKLEDFGGSDEEIEMFLASLVEEETEEAKKLQYKERKTLNDDDFAVVVTVKNKVTGKPRKIRMFPIHDESHVRNALARLGQAGPQATLKKLGVSIESVRNKILKRAKELNMKDLLERYQKSTEDWDKEISDLKVQLTQKDDEIKQLKTQIDEAKLSVDSAKLELEKVKTEKDTIKVELEKRIKKEKDNLIKARRAELTEEYSKTLSDEDILNDLKFENAKLKKELEIAKSNPAHGLETGDKHDSTDKNTDNQFKIQDKVRNRAFPDKGESKK